MQSLKFQYLFSSCGHVEGTLLDVQMKTWNIQYLNTVLEVAKLRNVVEQQSMTGQEIAVAIKLNILLHFSNFIYYALVA